MLLGGKSTSQRPYRVIINTDACNEIDDQMAIVHALLSPELKVEGIVAAHYGTKKCADSMERSYREILHLLDLLEMKNRVPILKGCPMAMRDPKVPQKSEGAEFIIERALAKDETDPLYIAYLGPLTDMASAYLMESSIAQGTVTLWIGGGWWPTGGPEFNAGNDWISADVVFQSNIPLVQYPRGTYRMMRVGVAEMERFVMGKGAIGDYLTSLFKEWRINTPTPRQWWVYGDSPAIGTLINPDWGFYESLPAPRLTQKLEYKHEPTKRMIEVCLEVTAGEIFNDFFKKLDAFAKNV
ncbi:MAG: nucleoside hydrolase [Clostridia bacterium]|jgi:hypothetical protein|nr:nucleoside hydrolase [Clostridia bacterium]